MKSHLLLVVICQLFIQTLQAQTAVISRIDSISGYGAKSDLIVYNDTAFLFMNRSQGRRLVQVVLSTQELTVIEPRIDYEVAGTTALIKEPDGFYFASCYQNGIFSSDHFVIHHISSGGTHSISPPFPGYLSLLEISLPKIIDGNYYFTVRRDDKDYLYEYNRILATATLVYFTPGHIRHYEKTGAEFLIVTASETTTSFWNKLPGSNATLAHSLNFASDHYLRSNEDSLIYFHKPITPYQFDLWQINTTSYASHLLVPDFSADQIFREPTRLRFGDYTYLDLATNELSSPAISSGLTMSQAAGSLYYLDNGLFAVSQRNTGYEFAHIVNDTITLLADFAPGSSSSFDGPGTPAHNYSEAIRYQLLTNGIGDRFYVYEWQNSQWTSLFAIENGRKVNLLHRKDDFIYWTENNKGILTLKRRSVFAVDPQQPTHSADTNTEWYRAIAYLHTTQFNWDADYRINPMGTEIDADNSTVIGFNTTDPVSQMLVNPSDSATDLPIIASNVFASYSPAGKLRWLTSLGGATMGATFNHNQFKALPNGDIVVVGAFYQKAYYNTDSLSVPGYGWYLARIDGQTGFVTSFKKIASSASSGAMRIGKLETDALDNIYLAFHYRSTLQHLDGVPMDAPPSPFPFNALARFNSNLACQWVSALPSSAETTYPEIFQLTVSSDNRTISAAVLTDIEQIAVQLIDSSGTSGDQFAMAGRLNTGILTNDNKYVGFTRFTGVSMLGNFSLVSTLAADGDPEYNGLLFTYDFAQKKFTDVKTTPERYFTTYSVREQGDNYYVLGALRSYYGVDSVMLLKLTKTRQVVGIKKLNQVKDWNSGYEDNESFDVRDGYISVMGTTFTDDETYHVLNLHPNVRNASLIRFKDENWETAPDFYLDIAPNQAEPSEEFTLYPNPFTDAITILFQTENVPYSSYEFFDLNGKLLLAGSLSDEQFQQVSAATLSHGLSLVRLSGEGVSETKRVVRE